MTGPAADVLITGARLWSEGTSIAGADSIALREGRIVALGRESELASLTGPRTRRIDARGATVTPGLTDAHIHLLAWARSRLELSLEGAASRAEAVSRVASFIREHPEVDVIVGRGWDDADWTEAPERAALDAVSGERVVLLHRRDFHGLWVNSAALRRAGVSRGTADPGGGRFERDAAGEPTGLVREHAVRLFRGLEVPEAEAATRRLVEQATEVLHRNGITTVHDFEGDEAMRMLGAMVRDGSMRLRVLMHLPHAGLDSALGLGLASGLGDDRFRIGAVKLFADGTLGSRTASMLEPYDDTGDRGMDLIPPPELSAVVKRALEGGLSVAIHAIGDRASRSALDAFEGAGPARGRAALPSRIEHVQRLDPSDLPRFAGLGVAASMQPSHLLTDRAAASRAWGDRCAQSYPWHSLLASGALLAFGSDAPVEPPDAALGLHAALTRLAPGSAEEPFVPAERITLDAALRAYTEAPARLAGQWPRVGRLAPGAGADVVVWDADLHALPPARLHEARVAATFAQGELVFERESREAPRSPAPMAAAEGRR